MNMQHPTALKRSLLELPAPSKRTRFGANSDEQSSVTPETNLADVVHAALDPAHASFRLANSSFVPTVHFSKSRTDTVDLSSLIKEVEGNPLWMMFPMGPDVPLSYTFAPTTAETAHSDALTTFTFAWSYDYSVDWFHQDKILLAAAQVDYPAVELPLVMEVHSLGTALGDSVSSLAFRAAKMRLELKGHSATSLILKGERRFMRVQDPFDITVYDDMDLDTLTSTPKYREPPSPLYSDPINILWGPEMCQRYLHKPPGEGSFDYPWFSHEFTMNEGDFFTYTAGSLNWKQRTFFAASGLHYNPLMFGTGIRLNFKVAHQKTSVVSINVDEVVLYRCTVGYYKYSKAAVSKKTVTWKSYTSFDGTFEIPLSREFGMRIPDMIVFDPLPPKPEHSKTGEIDWDPAEVKCSLVLTNCTPLPNGYVRHPLSLLKLTDFEDTAALSRTFDIAVEGVSVSSQRHLAPGDHPPVSAVPTENTLLAAHKAFHDPSSTLDYLMTDEEMATVGMDNRFSESEMIRTYGAMSFKKFGSGLWKIIKKLAPAVGRMAVREITPLLGAARYAKDPDTYRV